MERKPTGKLLVVDHLARRGYDHLWAADPWCETAAYPVSSGGVAVHFREITRHKETEEALLNGRQVAKLASEAGFVRFVQLVDSGRPCAGAAARERSADRHGQRRMEEVASRHLHSFCRAGSLRIP